MLIPCFTVYFLMRTLREYIDTFFCINPAAVVFLGLSNGMILFNLFQSSAGLAYITSFCIFSILILFLKIVKSELTLGVVAKFAIFSMLGWTSLQLRKCFFSLRRISNETSDCRLSKMQRYVSIKLYKK